MRKLLALTFLATLSAFGQQEARFYRTMSELTNANVSAIATGGRLTATTAGFLSPNDGGGAEWWWDPSVTNTSADMALSFPSAHLGVWRNTKTDLVNVKAAGAKGDGVTDDTAVFRRVFSAVGYQQAVYFPPTSVGYLISDTITNAKSANMIGSGLPSQILVSSSFPTNKDAFIIRPDTQRQGLTIAGIWLIPQSGTPGRDGIVFDVSATNTGLSGVYVTRNLIRTRNGRSFVVNNPNKDHDAFFTSTFVDNMEGLTPIALIGAGDSISIVRNLISTRNGSTAAGMVPAIYVDLIKAADPLNQGDASKLLIEGNNITSGGGAVHVVSGVRTTIRRNNIEGNNIGTNVTKNTQANSALIDLDGATNAVIYGSVIEDNFFGPNTHEYDVLIRVNNARDTVMRDNTFTPSGGTITAGVTNTNWRAVLVEAPAFSTEVGNNVWPYPAWYGWEAKMVNSAGNYTTVYQPKGFLSVPYGPTVTYIDPDVYDTFYVNVTDTNSFSVANPKTLGWLDPIAVGHSFSIIFQNNSGGTMGNITWGANYVVTNFVPPAAGRSAFVTFQYRADAKWYEINWSTITFTDWAETLVTTADDQVEAQQQILTLPTINSTNGSPNLLWGILNGGLPMLTDPEFASGVNGVTLFDSSGGGKVTLTRETGKAEAPNASKAWMRFTYDGTGTYNVDPAPYYGTIYQSFTPGTNEVIVHRFLAKMPVGLYWQKAVNGTLGTGSTNYWLTPYVGTGKWEYYAVMYVAGTAGISGSGGYYYPTKSSWSDANPFDILIASMTPIKLNTAQPDTTGSGTSVHVAGSAVSTPNFTSTTSIYWSYAGTNVFADLQDRDYGPVTVSGGGATWAIDTGAVTYDKIQTVTAGRLLGRGSSGAGAPEELTPGSGLSISGTTLSVTIAAGTNTSVIGVDGVPVNNPTLDDSTQVVFDVASSNITARLADRDWGDWTTSGSGASAVIDTNAVTYAKMQDASAGSILLGRGDSGAGDPQEITIGAGLAMSGTTLNVTAVGGTNTSTVHVNGTPVAGPDFDDTTIVKHTVSGTNVTTRLADRDNGDIVLSDSGEKWDIDNNVVSNAKAADMANGTIKGRSTAGTGDPEDLTGAQATALLSTFTSGAKGLVPASGGGTTTYLRADGTFSAIPGLTDGDKTDITVSSAGTVWTINANAVALATDTTGPYIATVAGTANEVSVSGSGTENAAVTLSLPSTIDLGGKTSFELPNGASPTVDAFGEIAADNDAWGASRGTVVIYDGTAATRAVNVLSSDTPADGDVPTFNTGGTITWEAGSKRYGSFKFQTTANSISSSSYTGRITALSHEAGDSTTQMRVGLTFSPAFANTDYMVVIEVEDTNASSQHVAYHIYDKQTNSFKIRATYVDSASFGAQPNGAIFRGWLMN